MASLDPNRSVSESPRLMVTHSFEFEEKAWDTEFSCGEDCIYGSFRETVGGGDIMQIKCILGILLWR